MPDKDRGAHPLSPASSRPTRGVDGRAAAAVLLLTTATLVPNHSQSHAATPPCRHAGLFLTRPPLPARLNHHEGERQGNLSRLEKLALHARLYFTRNPDDQVPPCTVNSPRAVLSTVPCASAGSAFLSALRQSGRRAHPSHVFSSLSRSLKTTLHHQVSNRPAGLSTSGAESMPRSAPLFMSQPGPSAAVAAIRPKTPRCVPVE
jgi:hypothetical protein